MIDTVIFIAYLAVILAVGLWAGRSVSTIQDYATSRQGFGSLVIFATMSASFIGGGFSTGNAEKVFLFGIANIVALWGFSFKELFVAMQLAPRLAKFQDAISVGDIMASAYGKSGRVITGICGLILCCGIVGAQVGAVGYVFQNFFGIDQLYGIVIGCSIVIIYTSIGGMRSVIFTDILQFTLLAIGLPVALVLGVYEVGGLSTLLDRIPADHLTIPGPDMTWFALLALFLVFLLGETLVPPYMQRLLAGRGAREAARGTLYSGLFSFPFFVVTGLIGLIALALDPDLNPNLAMPYVVDTVMPPVIKGVLFAAIISIVMSSADSFLNAASIAFVNDVFKPLRGNALSDRRELVLARAVTIIVGLSSVLFAISVESVLDILVYSYQYWAPVIVIPLIATIYGNPKSTAVFLWAAGSGAVVTFVWGTLLAEPAGISSIIVGVAVNLLVFLLLPAPAARGSSP